MTTIAETERFAARYLEAWRAGDPERIAALHAPNGRFLAHAGGGAPVTGRAAMRASFAEILDRFPGFDVEVHRLLTGPGHWALDWTLTAEDGVRIGCVDLVELADGPLVARKDTWTDAGGTS